MDDPVLDEKSVGPVQELLPRGKGTRAVPQVQGELWRGPNGLRDGSVRFSPGPIDGSSPEGSPGKGSGGYAGTERGSFGSVGSRGGATTGGTCPSKSLTSHAF